MPTAPYDIVEQVLQTARVRMNDAIQTLAGDVLTDTAPFTQAIVNSAWRRFQESLVDLGEVKLVSETILANLPVAASADVGVQVWLDWTGFNDGSSLNTLFVLPQDFISPMSLWERVHGGTGSAANYQEMSQVLKGLPTFPKGTTNKMWEWRSEKIYMPGATVTTDLRLRYAAFAADFVTSGGVLWMNQPVPIMRSLSPLAWLICSELVRARGDGDAGWFDQKAQEATMFVFNRNLAQGRQQFAVAESGKTSDQYTPATGLPVRGVK